MIQSSQSASEWLVFAPEIVAFAQKEIFVAIFFVEVVFLLAGWSWRVWILRDERSAHVEQRRVSDVVGGEGRAAIERDAQVADRVDDLLGYVAAELVVDLGLQAAHQLVWLGLDSQ
jgi:hypothetical protein